MCECVCWRACAVPESRSALRLYSIDGTGVVSVGEMSHKVKLKLHSSEGGRRRREQVREQRSQKSDSGGGKAHLTDRQTEAVYVLMIW